MEGRFRAQSSHSWYRAQWRQRAVSDEAAPSFRDDCAPGIRDDLAPLRLGSCWS
ncbi:hypothetical protein GOC29_28600 [Sinorhizobium meliloti]|nr:hypothetical protein [Sinorhizobium meliloti]MDW9685788.1 hypothetical protein [Sinorhizobium meliloti]MDX0134656.1 hypothetical protein [Sinorhizobium meliloti]